MKNASATKRRKLTNTSTGTLTPALPILTLPIDLIIEIFYKLSVKQLLLLRCVCKSFNSLISDPKFAKNHFPLSTPRHHLMVSSLNKFPDFFLFDFTVHLSTSGIMPKQLYFPDHIKKLYGSPVRVCSCDGILCFVMAQGSVVLCNPCIRKFKLLPPLKTEQGRPLSSYSFGYDPFIQGYKIVAISFFKDNTNAVSVYTLGTNSWRRIQDFRYSLYDTRRSGVFVNGTVNWLAREYDASSRSQLTIVSLDLENELYQKLWGPRLKMFKCILEVLKDCLCIFSSSFMFTHVWVMKEYGNKDSWTKLYSISSIRQWWGYDSNAMSLCRYEDQMLIKIGSAGLMFCMIEYKKGALMFLENQYNNRWMGPNIYIESLISPCF